MRTATCKAVRERRHSRGPGRQNIGRSRTVALAHIVSVKYYLRLILGMKAGLERTPRTESSLLLSPILPSIPSLRESLTRPVNVIHARLTGVIALHQHG
jgi:hypothetical protein